MRILETRTATGSEHFSCQDRIVSQIFILLISNGEMILSKVNVIVWGQVKSENSSLPVAVRVSETRVLKLPNYTSDSLWKIWFVESIQSIHKSLWTWQDTAISAADIAFIMSSSTSAWLLSPLECSLQKQNGWTLRFCFWGWIMWKMYNKTIIEFGFRMISWIIKTLCQCYLSQPSASVW